MARVVAFVEDLLFGSTVLQAIRASGHEGALCSDPQSLGEALADAELLIADLTFDAAQRVALVSKMRPTTLPVLAFYSHVEADVARAAREAGFDLVVPRSRMAREGAALIARLLSSRPGEGPLR